MIREQAATACAKSILEPLVSDAQMANLLPLVAAIIQVAVKGDELDQMIEAGKVKIPERRA